MSFFMWLFSEKKLADTYPAAIGRYEQLSDKEKITLYQEYCGWEET